jgi:ribokinase
VVHAVDVIVPNRSEAERLTASEPGTAPDVLLDHLRGLCAGAIVLTLGAEGCIVDDGSSSQRVPAPAALKVVDTTGAGDAFIGALATGLARGLDLRAASEVAVTAASFSVGIGAVVPSLPHLSDLPEGLRERISGGMAKR